MPNQLFHAFITPSPFITSLLDHFGFEWLAALYAPDLTTKDENKVKHFDPEKLTGESGAKIIAKCEGANIVMTDVETPIAHLVRHPPDPRTPEFYAALGEIMGMMEAIKLKLSDKLHVAYAYPGSVGPRFAYVDIIAEHFLDVLMPVVYAKSTGGWKDEIGIRMGHAIAMHERTGQQLIPIISDRVVVKEGDVRVFHPVPDEDLDFILEATKGYDRCAWSAVGWKGFDGYENFVIAETLAEGYVPADIDANQIHFIERCYRATREVQDGK